MDSHFRSTLEGQIYGPATLKRLKTAVNHGSSMSTFLSMLVMMVFVVIVRVGMRLGWMDV
jgi:hypothetical protein